MSTFSNLKPINVALPQGFGYIGLIATGSLLLNVYQSIAVGRARKASGITYPRMYATEEEVKTSTQAKIYNCVQRSHQNLLEQLPAFWITLFIGGLKFPRTVVGLGVTFLIGRVLYHAGESLTLCSESKRPP